MLYLVIKCSELGDQWECDANREPVCLTEDISKYGLGYEVYKVNPDNTFTLIKDYESALEYGMALYYWDKDDTNENALPTIIEKWKEWDRYSVTNSRVKNIKKKVGFHNTVTEIINDIITCGTHGEEIQGKWVVLGEYIDGSYSLGY